LVPNFTSTGFKVVQAPVALHKQLYDRLHEKLGTASEVEKGA
jgi:hypothetical protein